MLLYCLLCSTIFVAEPLAVGIIQDIFHYVDLDIGIKSYVKICVRNVILFRCLAAVKSYLKMTEFQKYVYSTYWLSFPRTRVHVLCVGCKEIPSSYFYPEGLRVRI